MGLLFILALLLAWPTFGISLLVFFAYAFLRSKGGAGVAVVKATLSFSADRIAQKAASSEAFNRGVGTAFSNDAVEVFFHKYGTTEKKFEYRPNPPMYIGYVKVAQQNEFLCVALLQAGGSTVASFRLEVGHGQDFLGLMAKKLFVDEIASRLSEAAR